jgi:hypothetical protein
VKMLNTIEMVSARWVPMKCNDDEKMRKQISTCGWQQEVNKHANERRESRRTSKRFLSGRFSHAPASPGISDVLVLLFLVRRLGLLLIVSTRKRQ